MGYKTCVKHFELRFYKNMSLKLGMPEISWYRDYYSFVECTSMLPTSRNREDGFIIDLRLDPAHEQLNVLLCGQCSGFLIPKIADE